MSWKMIGASVTGSSHSKTGAECQDSHACGVIQTAEEAVLYCFAADGAGSAACSAYASALACHTAEAFVKEKTGEGILITEPLIYELLESIYEKLQTEAAAQNTSLREYACTFLGAIVQPHRSVFFQIGDGVMIINREGGSFYEYIFWPDNGEYQNTTYFLIESEQFPYLNIKILEGDPVTEVAMLTDGLQLLCLDYEKRGVHAPFFTPMFEVLRKADGESKISIVNKKLYEYLDGAVINSRTDDDKTLILATRI